jgi:sterol 14-demethylase
MGHKRATIVMGNDAQHVFFSGHDDTLLAAPVYKFTIPVFGKGIVYDAPPNVMMQQTKFLAKGLMASALRAHCTKIIREAEEYFGSWADEGVVDLYTAFSELTILTASRCLLGKEIRESVHKQFADYYQELSVTIPSTLYHLTIILASLHLQCCRSQIGWYESLISSISLCPNRRS